MAQSRDRISRSVDVEAVFAQRRSTLSLGILVDEPETPLSQRTPMQHRPGTILSHRSPMQHRPGTTNNATPGRLRIFGSPVVSSGYENSVSFRGGGSGTNSVLPSWYPRTPFRDITPIMRAIERQRLGLRELPGQQTERPVTQGVGLFDSSQPSNVQLEHDKSMITPGPAGGSKHRRTFSKVLDQVINQTTEGSEFLTPQKKLLNSIEKLEKVVIEEFDKRTPAAKRAERKTKVRTLMSMR